MSFDELAYAMIARQGQHMEPPAFEVNDDLVATLRSIFVYLFSLSLEYLIFSIYDRLCP